MSTSSTARDEALLEVGRRRRLVHPGRLEQAVTAARGSSLANSLRSVLTGDELKVLHEAAQRSRYICPRGCVQLGFVDLQTLQALVCPRCGAGLTGAEDPQATRPTGKFDTAPGTAWGGTPSTADAPRVIGGYEIVKLLGRGSFGVVYLVRRPGIERPFALKVLLNGSSSDPELLARFRLEAAVASKLEHPGIVSVVATGQHEELPYLVMEYCAGRNLRETLREGPLPPADAARLVAEIARAVAYAHDRGVVHRDLKPANIILEATTGKPRVTDFGLARDRSLAASMTRTGDVIGTPAYASPEQLRGEKDVDARADVYALGVILYECLTGTRPFVGADVVSLAEAVLRGPLKSPREHDSRITEPLERACLRALARDRDARTPRAIDLAEELDAALTARRTSRRERARGLRPPRRRRLALGALATIVAVASGVAVWWHATPDVAPSTPVAANPTDERRPSPPPDDDDDGPPSSPILTVPRSTEPSPPPRAGARRAQDDELAPLLAAARRVRWSERGNDAGAVNLLVDRLPDLARRFPEDGRVVLLAGLADLLRSPHDVDELPIRRALIRSLTLDPPAPEFLRDRIARLCHVLGFERAAADVLEPMFVGGALPESWQIQCLMQVKAKSGMPVLDLPRAIELSRTAVRKRDEEAMGLDEDQARWFLPRAWMLREMEADLLVSAGDVAGGIRLRRELVKYHLGRGHRGMDEAAENKEIADVLEGGPNPRFYGVPGRSIRFGFPVTRFVHLLGEHIALGDQLREHEAASNLVAVTTDSRAILDAPHKALMLVAAANLWTRMDDRVSALAVLETAAAIELGEADRDVRALVLRSLAGLLRDDPVRAEFLARQAVEAASDPACTSGERVDAWLVVAAARRERGDEAGVAEALAQASALQPYDRRWLDVLQKR